VATAAPRRRQSESSCSGARRVAGSAAIGREGFSAASRENLSDLSARPGILGTQPIENGERCLFRTRCEIARRTYAGRAALLARTASDQLTHLGDERFVCAKQRLRKTDAARI